MRRYVKSLSALVLVSFLAGCGDTGGSGDTKADGKQAAAGSDTSWFFGGRFIPGDGSPAIEEATFLVTNGKFVSIGKKGEVAPPKGSNRVELTGRTVTPVFINLSAQPGMNNGAQYGTKIYNRDSMTADLSRYEYYGVMAVLTAGTDSGELASSVRDELRQGKIKGARLYTAGKGIAAKGGGPQALADSTIYVSSAVDARRAVSDLAEQKVDAVKLWMDDGNGKGAKLKSDAFRSEE